MWTTRTLHKKEPNAASVLKRKPNEEVWRWSKHWCKRAAVSTCKIQHLNCLCRPFGSSSKHYKRCNIHFTSESIRGQVRNQSSWRNVQAVFEQLFFVWRTKVFVNTILEHYSRTMFSETVRIEELASQRLVDEWFLIVKAQLEHLGGHIRAKHSSSNHK